MKVIGCGFGRTGTSSLRTALDLLGQGPTLHAHAFGSVQFPLQRPWHSFINGVRVPWDRLLDGHQSCVDWPTTYYWRQLMEEYPDARFVLTHRPAREWLPSFKNTILKNIVTHVGTPLQNSWGWAVIGVLTFEQDFSDENLLRTYARHIANVRASFKEYPTRLLDFNIKEGWGPLCRFLGAPIPDAPFPVLNDGATFEDDTIYINDDNKDLYMEIAS